MPNQAAYLKYLRKLDSVVIPKEFTYWVHNTLYGKENSRMWDEIPTDSFTVKREMSFVDRDSRVMEAMDYGGLYKANTSYGSSKYAKNFQIRVIFPKYRLSDDQVRDLGITPEEMKQNKFEYEGLGDRRHPKLKGGEKIYIFASARKDEISKKNIDILYGVREQDIVRYAEAVQKSITRFSIKPFHLSERTESYRTGSSMNRNTAQADYFDSVNTPYSLNRDPDLSRFKRKKVLNKDGKVILVQLSPFEQEYMHDVEKSKEVHNSYLGGTTDKLDDER